MKITEEDRKIRRRQDGVITIPAAATSKPTEEHAARSSSWTASSAASSCTTAAPAGSQEFEYTFDAPAAGKYALTARVATPSWKQNLLVTVNDADEAGRRSPLPHTVGMWDTTEPVAVELKNGRNVLRFTRDSDGNAKGITIKEFKLVPWDSRATALTEDEPAAEERGMSPSYQRLLGTSLLQALAGISADGRLEPLPMDLSITGSRVRLLEAKGSGILAFQAEEGGKIVAVALDDLKLEDHALLARLVARLCPDDPAANARAGVYMECLGDPSLAAEYQRKAGSEAVEQFATMLESAAE